MTSDPAISELSPIKRALIEIRNLKARLEELEESHPEPIAIIGMGLRFPGDVNDAESFWQLLQHGVDAITEVPSDRWSLEEFYDADVSVPGKMTTRYGAFLKNIDGFDAAFFGISPREAVSMDPQQRLLLQTSWEALENAGQAAEKLLGTQTGVFVGISNSDYFRMLISDPVKIDIYASTGGTLSVAAGRISYLLGLNGPALAVDTACSSSLVAVHLACHSLHRNECNLALVGGVNIILTPETNINFSKAGMMALDGRCKTFDAQADGYVRGEGCAMIVLKRLSEAVADKDNILAVIRGSAINQDGRSSGLTAPNGPAQEAVIRAALRSAGLEPLSVGYVEAHGTGTPLGDPIEVRALGAVYGPGRAPSQPLQIGSVKTNFGHLEAAAGIAGLLKTILALQHGEIPPHLHFRDPNPFIAWADFPVAIPVSGQVWQPIDGRRIAGVSSFGFSGTNAHLILEEAPPEPAAQTGGPTTASGVEAEVPEKANERLLLVTFSAKSAATLRGLAENYEKMLSRRPFSSAEFQVLAHTASVGRSHYAHRLAVVAANAEQLREHLAAFRMGQNTHHWWQGQSATNNQLPVVFLFTGHGSHYVNMGRQLYENVPVFRRTMERCDELLRPYLPVSLLSVLYPPQPTSIGVTAPGSTAQTQSTVYQASINFLNDMTYGQPAMFALEYSLAIMWRSWGIEPAAVAGHSLGEYAAAAIAGVLSLEDALLLIAERGRLMQQLPEDGLMVSVFADEERVAALIAPYASQVSIAAINSPETIVISGQRGAVLQAVEALNAQQIRTRPLNISRAAHSPAVESMIPGIAKTTAQLHFSLPEIEFFSSVTGEVISDGLTHPEYWQRHLRQTVRFAAAIQACYLAGYRCFLEVGPHPTLINLGQRTVTANQPALWLPSLREGLDDWALVLESMAQLYCNGANFDWASVQGEISQSKFPLPTYPWEQKSYWWKSEPASATHATAPVWAVAVAAGQRQSQQAPLDLEVSTYPAKWAALNQLTRVYIVNALCNLGAFADGGQHYTILQLLEKCAILPTYRHLMTRWLDLLVAAGQLQLGAAGEYISSQPLAAQNEEIYRSAAQQALSDAPFMTDYLIECGEHLASVITGKESPLELMFPAGSMARAENLYQNWAHARYFNHIVGAVVAAVCQADPNKRLRLVEIGAGTGATTSVVLPMLPPARVTYHFTDVSDLFLGLARKKFAAYPFVRYGQLNIEQDGLAQGYGRGQFDMVIAANVIHATHSLSETLQNVRGLLSPEGVLVLFEATQHMPWFDITTGLIEGWQSFSDDLRNDSPLLPAAKWEMILRAEGFVDVVTFPNAGSPAEVLGETVIIARAQSQPASAGVTLEIERGGPEEHKAAANEPTPTDEFLQRLGEVLPDERKDLLIEFVRNHVMGVLHLDRDTPPDRKARLMDLGVDSLMAIELQGRLTLGLKLERKLPSTLVFDYPSIEEITDYLLRDVLTFGQTDLPPAAPADHSDHTAASLDIETLSDEKVEEMLLAKLKKLK